MIDEKRIKRFIEGAKEAFKEVDDPTFTFPMNIQSAYELATSIEELLKEQEPAHVQKCEFANMWLWCCGSCGVAITEGDKFCRMCGRTVKWDG